MAHKHNTLFALIIAIVLVHALAPVQANILSPEKQGDDIVALCKDKNVNLSTFKQLKQLVAKVGNSKCKLETKESIAGLVKVIEQTKDDLCSMESMKKHVDYHATNLHRYRTPKVGKDPKSFRRFAIAYGLQVSNLCKRNMLEALTGEAGQRKLGAMSEEVKDLFGQLASDAGPVARVLGYLGSRDEPLMPGDMRHFFEQHNNAEISLVNARMRLWQVSLAFIDRVRAQCEQTFSPIYGPYMMPLVELANLGLSYRDQVLESTLENPAIAMEIGSWSRVAFACEALASITIKDVTSQYETEGVKLVNIWPREVAAAHESPNSKVSLDLERPIFDKSDKRLVATIKATKIDAEKRVLISDKVSRMAADGASQLRKSDLLSLGYLVKRIEMKSYTATAQASPTQKLLESFDFYIKYPGDSDY